MTWLTQLDIPNAYLRQIHKQGYYQIAFTEEAKKISAFITLFRRFQYRVKLFGLMNARVMFQRATNATNQGLSEFIPTLTTMWSFQIIGTDMCLGCGPCLKVGGETYHKSCQSSSGSATIVSLGHMVNEGQAHLKQTNVEVMHNFPLPAVQKSFMRLLGMAGFSRRLYCNLSSILRLLSRTWPVLSFPSFGHRSAMLPSYSSGNCFHLALFWGLLNMQDPSPSTKLTP